MGELIRRGRIIDCLTPLHLAAIHGKEECLVELLKLDYRFNKDKTFPLFLQYCDGKNLFNDQSADSLNSVIKALPGIYKDSIFSYVKDGNIQDIKLLLFLASKERQQFIFAPSEFFFSMLSDFKALNSCIKIFQRHWHKFRSGGLLPIQYMIYNPATISSQRCAEGNKFISSTRG